jgi:hypothetical protein
VTAACNRRIVLSLLRSSQRRTRRCEAVQIARDEKHTHTRTHTKNQLYLVTWDHAAVAEVQACGCNHVVLQQIYDAAHEGTTTTTTTISNDTAETTTPSTSNTA